MSETTPILLCHYMRCCRDLKETKDILEIMVSLEMMLVNHIVWYIVNMSPRENVVTQATLVMMVLMDYQ